MIRIIVIEREYGCRASPIAEKLAQRIGWRLFDRQLTEQIAQLARVSADTVERREERLDPLFYRLAKTFWRGSYERSLPVSGLEAFDCDRMMTLMQRVVEAAAAEGNCVIVGRGAPYFLRDRADTLAVFLFAPREYRLKRVFELTKNETEANELVDTVDQERVAFVKHYFGKDWPYRPLYHAMLNTALGDDITIDAILNLMTRLNEEKPNPPASVHPG
jgi:cytidylate kinase